MKPQWSQRKAEAEEKAVKKLNGRLLSAFFLSLVVQDFFREISEEEELWH